MSVTADDLIFFFNRNAIFWKGCFFFVFCFVLVWFGFLFCFLLVFFFMFLCFFVVVVLVGFFYCFFVFFCFCCFVFWFVFFYFYFCLFVCFFCLFFCFCFFFFFFFGVGMLYYEHMRPNRYYVNIFFGQYSDKKYHSIMF